jgi:ribosomal protein S6
VSEEAVLKTVFEGLYIFPEGFTDEELTTSIDQVKGEIKKLGGNVLSTMNLGRRMFAREMKKQTAGMYVIIDMEIDGLKVDALKLRLKLGTNVFRAQYIKKEAATAEA